MNELEHHPFCHIDLDLCHPDCPIRKARGEINYTGYASTQYDEKHGIYQSVMMERPPTPEHPNANS